MKVRNLFNHSGLTHVLSKHICVPSAQGQILLARGITEILAGMLGHVGEDIERSDAEYRQMQGATPAPGRESFLQLAWGTTRPPWLKTGKTSPLPLIPTRITAAAHGPRQRPLLNRRRRRRHHSFLGSFSAVSKRNLATKYAFFQVFRDLQNYLADFLKKLRNFAKNRKILQNFCEISRFLQKKS